MSGVTASTGSKTRLEPRARDLTPPLDIGTAITSLAALAVAGLVLKFFLGGTKNGMGTKSDKDLLVWLRTDLAAAVEWHSSQAQRPWHDQAIRAAEEAKADMASTVLRRLDAYEAGQPPIHPKQHRPTRTESDVRTDD